VLTIKCNKHGLNVVARIVTSGGIIVYPTDTVYGLGCNPFDAKAVNRVIKLKGRIGKPLPILCSSIDKVVELVNLNELGLKLASKFWPGPLTLVAKMRERRLPYEVTLGIDKLGVRIPNHSCALKLINLCGGYLIGTSANRSGMKSPTNPDEVFKTLDSKFDVLVNGGPTPLRLESTVVDITPGRILIIREGALKERDIMGT